MNNKILFKISNKLSTHDSIIHAITNRGMKHILTLEQGNFFYWVRLYEDGETQLFKNNKMFNDYKKAYNYFTKIRAKLRRQNLKLHYNTYDNFKYKNL